MREHGNTAGDDGTTRNDIVVEVVPVDVVQDTGVVGAIESGSRYASRVVRSGAGNFQVHALGVTLRSVLLTCAVKGSDIVTKNIVAGSNIGRDADGPRVAVVNQHGCRPLICLLGRIDKAGAVNLEKLECCLVNGVARPIAVCQEIHNGSLVTVRPLRPLELHSIASSNCDSALARHCLSVADDIGGIVSVRCDKAVVALVYRPAGHERRVTGVWVLDGDVVAV